LVSEKVIEVQPHHIQSALDTDTAFIDFAIVGASNRSSIGKSSL